MNPLFFGPTEAPLYGVYHPPRATPRSHGVVLCNAFGQEYMRAHRAYRQLAMLLNRKGFHVLRFDYRGTGDSWGDLDSVVAQHWLEDIGHAITELRDNAGVTEISVLGMRLGALLASAACASRSDIERLIVWDPVTSGAAYEQELLTAIASEKPSEYSARPGNGETVEGGLSYNGFTMSRRLRESLRELQVEGLRSSSVRKLFQIVSHETAAFNQLRDAMRDHAGYRYQFAAAPHDWNYVDNFGGILLPQPVIQAVVQWMEAS